MLAEFDQKNSWYPLLQEFFQEKQDILPKLAQCDATIYPQKEQILRAFQLTPVEAVKVVILGQDPYHGPHQANGLAFSVDKSVKIPPSLRNIYKELADDCNIAPPLTGVLTGWAEQGVLLLNSALTVESGKAGSHRNWGWEILTDRAIQWADQDENPKVFLLWGAHAQEKRKFIQHHLVLQSSHPSPLSAYRGFLGCGHFSKANSYLKEQNRGEIHWDRANSL